MRIAFYAPLKPPGHPVPSGERRIARLLLRALGKAGHDARVVSTFRSYEGEGNPARQESLRRRGTATAKRLLGGKLERWRPELWFTYHLYHKAPDWLGPPIAERLGIPYAVAEPAYAPRRARGRWDAGLAAVAAAMRRADIVFLLNPNDEECVAPLLRKDAGAFHGVHRLFEVTQDYRAWEERARTRPAAVEPLLPFLDVAPYRRAWRHRVRHRRAIARRYRLAAGMPWLLAVGMMRKGDKLASYRLLARALGGLTRNRWRLVVVGDGPARNDVRRSFAALRKRVHFLGALPAASLAPLYAASDLLVWPAINEAIGMAILEGQAAGLPAVVGRAGATGVIVAEGETGRLVPVGRAAPFRRAIADLLARPKDRRAMSQAAIVKINLFHDLDYAASHLRKALHAAVARARKRSRR